MKTVLVTGCAGFIGSHVAEQLLARGYRVVGLDNFDPYYERQLKEENLALLRPHPHFAFLPGDIREAQLLNGAVKSHQPWGLIHLAALAGVRPSLERPDEYMDVNVTGTTRVLQAAVANGVQRFIFASSSSVYGGGNAVPFAEDQPVCTPLSPYAASKIAGEACCHTYHSVYDLPIVCLRFFTVYGPRQRPDLAINKFTRLMLEGRPLPLFGDGSSSRDYTYIDDIARGVIGALESDLRWEVVNLGGSSPVTLSQLVKGLEQAVGVRAKIQRLPAQAGDMLRTCAEVTRARERLGWQARVPLAEGLARFAAWFARRRQAQEAASRVAARPVPRRKQMVHLRPLLEQ